MDTAFLETLVKLAALGASGISIFAIFWIGWLISRTPANADAQRHRSMRLFMVMCVAIAIIAGVTGYMNARIETETAAALENKLNAANAAVRQCDELRASVRGTLDVLERVVGSKALAAAGIGSTELERDVRILEGAISDLRARL